MRCTVVAVVVLALALVGGAAAYDDDFGNTFGSKAECLEWWGTYPEACSAEEDAGGGGGGGEEPAPDPEPQWPITFSSSPGTITLTEDDGSSETMPASEQDSSPEGRGVEPSAQGCRTIDVTRDIQSSFIPFQWDHLGVFHHYVYWCWTYPRITQFHSFCWSDVQGWAITDHGCRSSGNWYVWRGDDHGGRYSLQQADWGNCAFRYGCFNRIDPYIHIWINGNGTWTQTQGD